MESNLRESCIGECKRRSWSVAAGERERFQDAEGRPAELREQKRGAWVDRWKVLIMSKREMVRVILTKTYGEIILAI